MTRSQSRRGEISPSRLRLTSKWLCLLTLVGVERVPAVMKQQQRAGVKRTPQSEGGRARRTSDSEGCVKYVSFTTNDTVFIPAKQHLITARVNHSPPLTPLVNTVFIRRERRKKQRVRDRPSICYRAET